MRGPDITVCSVLRFLFTLCLVAILGLFIHELGHGLSAEILGGKFEELYVMPGIQVWPHPGAPYPDKWQGYIGLAIYTYGPDWNSGSWQVGVVEFMGSGSTLLTAILALGALGLLRPRGWPRLLLQSSSVMFVDLLFYTLLPLIGLRHWIIFGGKTPEPLEGAIKLGIPRWSFLLFVILVSALMIWGMIRVSRTHNVS